MTINFEQDCKDATPEHFSAGMAGITMYVDAAKILEQDALTLETKLAEKRREIMAIYQRKIPEIMLQYGLEKVRTTTGFDVSMKHHVKASISSENLNEACQWLSDNEHSHVIKNNITVEMKAGREQEAIELREMLQNQGYDVVQKRSVHAGTLSSLVRELKESGQNVPDKLLGVYEFDEAKVK